MRSRFLLSTVTAFALTAACLGSSAAAQTAAPRSTDGHPDLSGIWVAGNPNASRPKITEGQSVRVLIPVRGVHPDADVFKGLDVQGVAGRAGDPNKPPYKPELLSKIKELEDHQSQVDPAFYCKPAGVPRMGPPSQIVQSPGQVIFLYANTNTFRLIPTDGRQHRADIDSSYMGDSVAHWEGNTLVVDVRNLNDDTWLGPDGWIHTDAMHVTERLTREGDTLTYQATVEDPNVFTKAWPMTPRTLKISTQPLEEGPPCVEKDAEHLVTLEHH
jgi:hypothetical protein